MKNEADQTLKAYTKMVEAFLEMIQNDSELRTEAIRLGLVDDLKKSIEGTLVSLRKHLDSAIREGKLTDEGLIKRYQNLCATIDLNL